VQCWHASEATNERLAVLRRLKEDGFPRVWDWQRRGPRVDVVMTWIEGITLSEYLANLRAGRRPQVDPAHAIRLMQGLAAAITRLHHKLQISHGDVQPSNVVVTSHPSRLILIDFGSAWTTQRSAIREEGDGHQLAYAAPELQTPGAIAGFAADQFSASVIFYELLTRQLPYGGLGGKAGRPEFVGRTAGALIPPSKACDACGALPRSLGELLDRVVMRGLALRPDDRYLDRHAWLGDLFETAARFRIPPSLSTAESVLMRFVRRFVKPRIKT
jgi:serine/threonine protein kinase